jgi:hypothetical protein
MVLSLNSTSTSALNRWMPRPGDQQYRAGGRVHHGRPDRHWQGPHLRQHHALCPAAGKIALFITKDKPLYADMMRDVGDIGMRRFTPFHHRQRHRDSLGQWGGAEDGRGGKQKAEMQAMMQRGNLGRYSAVFTTYSQLQTVGKEGTPAANFLRKMAPNAILILDEAHQAGGSKGGWKEAGPPDRADFVRELIDKSSGVFYSSATYAKRADVMDLYARRTDLRLGVSSMTALENILTRGGVPLQQIVASKFVASGQMLGGSAPMRAFVSGQDRAGGSGGGR